MIQSPPNSFLITILIALFAVPSFAGHPSVPGGAAAEGSQSTEVPSDPFDGSVYQNIYTEVPGALAGSGLKIGDTITGISLRLDSSVSSFSGIYFDRFDIRIGTGKVNLVPTFADNFGGTVTQARTGPLLLFPQDMPTDGSPRSFGRVIKFDTPYVYRGQSILIETRVESDDDMRVDTIDTTDQAGMVFDLNSADATTGATSVGPAWAVAFEVIRGGKPALTNVNIPNGASVDGDSRAGGFGTNTEQFFFPEGLLSNLSPGDQICGFCLRLDARTLDSGSVTLGRFDVKIGRSAANFQTTNGALFADNFAALPTAGRSGPLTLLLPNNEMIPKPFGSFIAFDSPFTYPCGVLVMEWRTTSSNQPVDFDLFTLGEQAITSGDADATLVAGSNGIIPAVQFKVIKPPITTAGTTSVANDALRTSLNNKIKKLKKKIKKVKKSGNRSKAKKLTGKLKKLQKQLKAL